MLLSTLFLALTAMVASAAPVIETEDGESATPITIEKRTGSE